MYILTSLQKCNWETLCSKIETTNHEVICFLSMPSAFIIRCNVILVDTILRACCGCCMQNYCVCYVYDARYCFLVQRSSVSLARKSLRSLVQLFFAWKSESHERILSVSAIPVLSGSIPVCFWSLHVLAGVEGNAWHFSWQISVSLSRTDVMTLIVIDKPCFVMLCLLLFITVISSVMMSCHTE